MHTGTRDDDIVAVIDAGKVADAVDEVDGGLDCDAVKEGLVVGVDDDDGAGDTVNGGETVAVEVSELEWEAVADDERVPTGEPVRETVDEGVLESV